MLTVHVSIHVKAEFLGAFVAATLVNVRASRAEPGVARFDLLERQGDPTRFVLVEVYRTPDDAARHKATAHYATWRDTVADMMAEPRSSLKYADLADMPDMSEEEEE
jgi:autoinducer 2-degrading protein